MTSLKEKVLEYYEKGLKAKEISETLDEPYEIVSRIIQAARYQKNKDEISRETKEDRKINPEKYRLKRQKEKAKDPVRYNRRKRENWAKNYAIRTPEKIEKDRQKDALNLKQLRRQAQEGYSNGTPICACVKCDVTGLEFLTIDHIIPRKEMVKDPEMVKIGYEIGRKGEPLCRWVIKHNFPKGFQILCWNCNFAKGQSEDNKCPHETAH